MASPFKKFWESREFLQIQNNSVDNSETSQKTCALTTVKSCWTAFVFSTVVGTHEQSILILCLDQWVITVFGDLLEALITVETKQEISWWSSLKVDAG